tara:strand:+ start:2017 stop:2454 length:438 start_codon:yes stop_codon:yes gene_type:complete
MRDITNSIDLLVAFPPVAAVTNGDAQVSSIVDLQGYDSAMLAIALGTLTDTDAVWSVLLEESANGTDFTAVADDDLNGTEALAGFTFAADVGARKLGYVGAQRYIRATIDDSTANTGNLFLAALWVLGHAGIQPTANPPVLAPYT